MNETDLTDEELDDLIVELEKCNPNPGTWHALGVTHVRDVYRAVTELRARRVRQTAIQAQRDRLVENLTRRRDHYYERVKNAPITQFADVSGWHQLMCLILHECCGDSRMCSNEEKSDMPDMRDIFKFNFDACYDLMLKKNVEHGTANIAESHFAGVVARMRDKVARLSSIDPTADGAWATALDAAMDLANYGIIAQMLLRGQWPGARLWAIDPHLFDLRERMSHAQKAKLLESWMPNTDPGPVRPSLGPIEVMTFGDGIREPAIDGDVGYDLVADKRYILDTAQPTYVWSNAKIAMPEGMFALILPRSSSFKKKLIITTGVIDSGYRGPLAAAATNIDAGPTIVEPGDRLAQVVFFPAVRPQITRCSESAWEEAQLTKRGANGFGSTGK